MTATKINAINYKTVLGVFIILAGLLGLLNSLDVETGFDFWDIWPLILVVIGIGKLMQPAEYRNTFGGLVILGIGLVLQLAVLDFIDFGFRHLWPVLLILVGLAITRQAFWPARKAGDIESDIINYSVVMGGGEYKFTSNQLVGGSAGAIMGGGIINLADAEMQADSMVIDVFAFMGGIDLIIPRHWNVTFNGLPIMGGMSDKTLSPSKTNTGPDIDKQPKQLIIKGMVLMGGVEVKN